MEAGAIRDAAEYAGIINKEAAFKKAEEERRWKADLKTHKAQLKDWRDFKTNYIKTRVGYDYLRFDKASGMVQTSQRVEIPEAIGRQFYRIVMTTIENGGCTDCNMALMDRYEVEEINKDFIRVGCHKISLKEIRAFTKKMGW